MLFVLELRLFDPSLYPRESVNPDVILDWLLTDCVFEGDTVVFTDDETLWRLEIELLDLT